MLAFDALRVDIGEPGTHHARLQIGQPFFGHIQRIQTAAAVHHRAHGQGFAAGAGAEIHCHLPALHTGEQSQQLAAFVLHFQRAVQKQRVFVERGFVGKADAPRRIRCGAARQPFGLQGGQYFVAAAFKGVYAHIQRCALHHAAAECQHGVVIKAVGAHGVNQPLRQLGGSV